MRATPRLFATATVIATISAAALSAACKTDTGPSLQGLSACGTGTLLTTTPMALSDIREIAPLGNLNPPGHVFPTDHIYFYAVTGPAVPVQSPGAVRITTVLLQKRTGGGAAELDDYGLDFYPCTTQHFWFAHIASLTPSLVTQVGDLSGSCNAPYMTGGYTYTQCRKDVSIDLTGGDAIGTAGGPTEGALDLGATDEASAPLQYVDPSRVTGEGGLHAVCPVDYFVGGVRDSLRARFAANGVHRVAAPVCGTVMQDVANTAQGRWFHDATTQEDPHLALVSQNWDPSIGAFSIGTSLTGSTPGVLMFTPAASGRVNAALATVTSDGNIYCYNFTNSTGRVFVQLISSSQLKIELAGTGACGAPSWSFGANAGTYSR